MKIKIELDIADDVNYEEIEELDAMAELFDELDDDWIDEEDEDSDYVKLIDSIYAAIRAAEDERYFKSTYVDPAEHKHFKDIRDAKIKVLNGLLPEDYEDLIY